MTNDKQAKKDEKKEIRRQEKELKKQINKVTKYVVIKRILAGLLIAMTVLSLAAPIIIYFTSTSVANIY